MYRHLFYRNLLSLGALLILLLTLSPLALAECPGNILPNPGFEEGFSSRGASEVEVAKKWHPWYQDGPNSNDGYNWRPEYNAEDASRFGRRRVREGNWGQNWVNFSATHHAGIYQQVNVVAGSLLTLKAWGQSWSSDRDDPAVSHNGKYALSVGIDPTGGTDWRSPNIVWSPQNGTMDQWVEFTLQTRAQAGTVTVYLRGDAEWKMKHNDAYFDDLCLTVEAPPPPTARPTAVPRPTSIPTTPAPPTNTPEPAATDTPAPTATPPQTATPVTAKIRVSVYDDANGNGKKEDNEALIPGAKVELRDAQDAPVATHTTAAGAADTFEGLAAGTYKLVVTHPSSYIATTPNQWGVTLAEGAQVEFTFGGRAEPTDTATPKPSSTPAPTRTPLPTPTPLPEPQGNGSGGLVGLLVAAVAISLPFALRLLRGRARPQ